MRKLVQQLLESVDPANFPADKIIQASSADDALRQMPDLPFVVLRFSIGRASASRRGQPSLDVWVYDVPGSYLRIDAFLRACRATLLAAQDLRGSGEHIAQIDWVNDSADLPAEEYGGIVRMGTFTLTGSSA
jgi:hypothetical protein